MVINILKTHVTPEWRPYSVPTAFKKMQIAEVRAVQTPATLDGPTDRPSDGRDKTNLL